MHVIHMQAQTPLERRTLRIATVVMAAMAMLSVSSFAQAQQYPVKPITIVVGFVAGGAADLVARMTAERLSSEFGRQVLVENRAGAGSAIATERVVKAAPDGYTLFMMSASATILPALRKLPYDLEKDLTPVSMVSSGPLVVAVHPSVPAKTAKDLIALARAKPGMLSYASNGAGSPSHLSGELMASMLNSKMLHVPYKGGSEMVVATAAGEVDISFPTIPPALALVDAGRIRALAVTSQKRASMIPDVPTFHESGLKGYDMTNWNGLSAPAGTPKEVIARLNAAIAKSINTPETRATFGKQGLEPQTSTPEQLAAFLRTDIERNAKLIRLSGAKQE
jgi:tripartite-type tricarboxylate transporter receptor subunit TctC